MAMTKKEQAAMKAAIDRAETLAALRWTQPVEPDVMPPMQMGVYVEGWNYSTSTFKVNKEFTGSHTHGFGPLGDGGPIREYVGSVRLYSTKAKALAALRHCVENQAAKKLLDIDRELAELNAQDGLVPRGTNGGEYAND